METMKRAKRQVFPALRGVVGDWVYYSTLMTAQQVAGSVLPAKSIREAKTLEDFLQRDLGQRVKRIKSYLLRNESRFFNSLVVGVFGGVPDWHEFSFGDAHPGVTSADLSSIRSSAGLLTLTGDEKMFAIDGQHRTAAITEAWEQVSGSDSSVLDDQYAVILVAHIDDADGKKRTRRLFADINKRAVPVSKGDLAIIDEDDICAIVARRLYAEFPLFKKLGPKPISLTKSTNLDPRDDEHFTNLLTLVTVNQRLKGLYKKKRATEESASENVDALRKVAEQFYSFVASHCPDLKRLFSRKVTIADLRDKEKSVVARPIGLVLLARLYAHCAKAEALPTLQRGLGKIDFALPGKHFNGLLWNKSRIENKHARVAFDLSLYLLGLRKAHGLLDEYQQALKNPNASLPAQVV